MEIQPAAGKRQKILVVDDDAIILKTLSFKLNSQGYDVLTAADGSEAVAAVRREKPDLILLDLFFPPDLTFVGGVRWDGFLLIEWVRRLEEGRHVPIIIVITGGDPTQTDQRALAAGAVKVFHKPIDHPALLETIRDMLSPGATPP